MSREMNKPVWIWCRSQVEETEKINIYAQFSRKFTYGGGTALIKLSVCDEYALYVNDQFVTCGQYDDYPNKKRFDTLDLAAFVRAGENSLRIDAYYQGVNSFQCVVSTPRLCYQLELGDELFLSGENTDARPFLAYRNGDMEKITMQLGYPFHYDARREDQAPWEPAVVVEDTFDTVMVPRPIKKLVLAGPSESKIIMHGVLLNAPGVDEEATPAQRVYFDLLSPRYERQELCVPPSASGLWQTGDFIRLPAGFDKNAGKSYCDAFLPLPSPGYAVMPQEGYDGVYLIVDTGRETAGFVVFDLEAAAGTVFDFGFGEHLDDGRVRSYITNRHFGFRYTAKQGRQSFAYYFKRLGCRYIQVHIRTQIPVTLYHLSLRSADYPVTEMPPPEHLQDKLALKIFEISRASLKLCMHEHYEDCPWREQALYGGDGWYQALAGFFAFREYEFPSACWQLMSESVQDRADGMLDMVAPAHSGLILPCSTLQWVLSSGDLARYGGIGYITYADTLCRVLHGFISRMSGNFLPNPSDAWNLYEWTNGMGGMRDGKVTQGLVEAPLNAMLVGALEAGVYICDQLGDRENSQAFTAAAQKIRRHFHDAFWDEPEQAYRTGADLQDRHFAELTQAAALMFHLVPPQQEPALRERLSRRHNGLVEVALNSYLFKMEALMQDPDRYYDTVYQDILEFWGSMVLRGATSFWETIDGANAFDRQGSLCHGWSGLPLYFFYRWQPR